MENFEREMMNIKNFAFWHTYLRLIEILLCFIKAQRTGDWLMHVEAFAAMLPWMSIYDHTNYARWGPVYLTDMKTMNIKAPDVHSEFVAGNFVVKRSNNYFNEVPTDQATEWINKVCKTASGIIGITRQDQARDRFCITWARRSQITNETVSLYGLLGDEDETTSNRTDSQTSRVNAEEEKVNALVGLLESLDVFGIAAHNKRRDTPGTTDQLVSIASKDIATDGICNDLLTCERRGRALVEDFTKTRLEEKTTEFFVPVKKVKSRTFTTLYKSTTSDKQQVSKLIKADRKLLQRLFNAANSGRSVQTAEVLQHELSPVPLSLTTPSGAMNSTTKSQILNVLTTDLGIETPQELSNSDKSTCVIIDGHALIQAKGKPQGCQTFGDYAKVFVQSVYSHFNGSTSRVDVTFDRYLGEHSIKAATRTKRTGKRRPIRKQITGPDVPLPQIWDQYISLGDNKADLADFLSRELLKHRNMLPDGAVIVAGGGFSGQINAKSSGFNADHLSVTHEEADTRMIIRAKDAIVRGYQRLVVYCRDTDVLLLLIYHVGLDAEVWMISGAAKQCRCYPVHAISEALDEEIRQNILGFHALTGCDTTSSFHGISKKSCWKRYTEDPTLLASVGHDGGTSSIELFLCGLYGCCTQDQHDPDIDTCRYRLFMKAKKSLELLPPTKDALELHTTRANYQAKIWINAANVAFEPEEPVATGGWTEDAGTISPIWIRKPPVPSACMQLVSCGCKTKCNTARCKCYKSRQVCLFECGCEATNCANPADNTDN